MNRRVERPGYLVLLAVAAGAIVAAVIVVLVVLGGDGDGEEQQAAATTTAGATPGATGDSGGTPAAGTATEPPASTATATPGAFQDPEAALAAFVHDELQSVYTGDCPQELPPGEEPPQGYCSVELYRSVELATFNVGRFASEALGEAVVTPNEDGTWSLDFLEFPALDAQIAVGSDAMVFQAHDCLNFREEPSLSAEALWCLVDGTRARVAEGPVEADGHTWWRLEELGWASSSYLAPVAE